MSNISTRHVHQGRYSTITFDRPQQGPLHVVIETNRLIIRSVGAASDYEWYAKLYGNPTVMAKFERGVTKPQEEITTRITTLWKKRWDDGDLS